jgi:hypothetical protein
MFMSRAMTKGQGVPSTRPDMDAYLALLRKQFLEAYGGQLPMFLQMARPHMKTQGAPPATHPMAQQQLQMFSNLGGVNRKGLATPLAPAPPPPAAPFLTRADKYRRP